MGIYTPAVYVERRSELDFKRDALADELQSLSAPKPASKAEIIPLVRTVIEAYPLAQSVKQKNALLKSILVRVDYHKTIAAKRGESGAKYLTLDVQPVLSYTS